MRLGFFLVFCGVVSSSFAEIDKCLGWFLKSGLASEAKECELKCLVTPVDMSSFSCTSQCHSLCSTSIVHEALKYVPRLTEGDKIVLAKMPYESIKVFMAKERVNKLTTNIFGNPSRKDESDAYRHFVWSVLVAQEIGVGKAKIFLDAHEDDSTQSSEEKQMDVFNNKKGLEFFKSSQKNKKILELNEIEKEALDLLKRKKLNILEPKLKKIPGGYYSK